MIYYINTIYHNVLEGGKWKLKLKFQAKLDILASYVIVLNN